MSELRMEERVNERMRIARELHDTLLQGFIGARMQLDTAVDQLPADSPSKPRLARVLQIMGEVIDEGRSALHGFRTSESDTENLEKALSKVPEELELKDPVSFRLIVEGHAQSLRPLIQHEVYSIGREALLNSFRHSGASRIEIELEYSPSQLRVLARDDGRGIDAQVLQFGRQGHWGLLGMRERAERIGAQLKILSRAGVGTEVELCIPGSIAFDSPNSDLTRKRSSA
jgi:signal transduction histidine kinase